MNNNNLPPNYSLIHTFPCSESNDKFPRSPIVDEELSKRYEVPIRKDNNRTFNSNFDTFGSTSNNLESFAGLKDFKEDFDEEKNLKEVKPIFDSNRNLKRLQTPNFSNSSNMITSNLQSEVSNI